MAMGRSQLVPMAPIVLFAAFVLHAAIHAAAQPPADFLSIDCGLEANYSGYKDPTTGIVYVSDEPYANSGENHRIAADQESKWSGATNLRTLRSFPSGVRNCYALPTHAGTRYLVRLSFLHGSYDGNAGWSTLRFDLYLGANRWATVDKDYAHEAVFVARASWSPVCLVNTGSGTPFVSLVELRPLDAALYPSVMANQSMARYIRCSFADNKKFITRYPDDQYDRYWWQLGYTSPTWKNLSTVSAIKQDPTYTVPLTIIQTAIEAVGNNTTLNITWQDTTPGGRGLKFFMYFADFQNSQLRQFNVSFNDVEPYQYSPPYLSTSVLYNTGWSTAGDGVYNISLVPTAASKLPPMINALEIYTLISLDSPTTSQEDFSTVEPSRHQPKHDDTLQTGQDHGDVLQIVENRQFTYKELEKITNKFERPIGKGGFGPVYYGHLEDKTEVAVKMRSESSSHGLDEFFAEVRNLTMVHHRNLVSLVGYCWENDHLALVYEYMAKGSICDRLRGNNNAVSETLNWRTRVRIMVEAAQGLDYLHKGCNLPIIHRDVKTNNILLGQNLQAKIADFGLSKTYLSETQTHITITPAGTAGYIDPEYYQTGRLTESSDVYSFGIVMLEIATGESPIIQGEGHIVQRVKRKIVAGNIHLIADARLGGAYDVSSMWKVVDTALLCTADVVAQRPTMSIVVAQLRECLALEEARGDSGLMGSSSTASDNLFPTSTFAPVAR
uniref:Protein kinase domain-containing protein n=1 Tax=Oryza brachyantha TaxID=4533 RepID=J3MWS1_ORYBR